jgi:Mg2+ and Co2+ transporter CorA
MSALALKYQLHPLAVEDVFHSGQTSISKADYYRNHLFIHILTISTSSKKASPLQAKYLRGDPTASDSEEEDTDVEEDAPEEDVATVPRLQTKRSRQRRKSTAESVKPKAPLRWTELAILLSPVSSYCFLIQISQPQIGSS